MIKKWLPILLVILAFLSINFSGATGQSYSFQVPTASVNYAINADGTATIEYTYHFVNNPGAPAIEFVDIGLPAGSRYSYSDMSAEIDGNTIQHIQRSEYISNGVEFGLGSFAIQPGSSGTFIATIYNVREIIFPGTAEEQEPYAGTQFQPNYFESGTVTGNTEMTVTIFLPPGMSTEEPRYYEPEGWPGSSEPESGFIDDRVYYRWFSAEADLTDRYVFGASFPARLVPESAISEPPSENGGTLGSGLLTGLFENLFGFGCCAFFAIFFGWSIYQGTIGAQKRKMKYLPPKVAIEGHGIKRGLTAVEAAILMEQPMDKVLTMVLFSVVKKGAAEVITRDPLEIKILEPQPEELRAYELDFLRAFEHKNNAARRNALQDLMVKLVRSVTQKMKGFSYKETVEYYQNIIEKAWEYVAQEGTPEVQMQKLDEAMDWTMADRDYEERTRRVFTGPVYVPMWWGRYDPTIRPSTASAGSSGGASPGGASPGGKPISLPQLPGSDFAASVVNSVQGFSAGVIGNLTSFTSGITNKTNPIPRSSGGSSSRSGGGCACACACASCACACAGGGR